MQITNIALSRLLKLELPQLAKNVLEIVEKHEPEVLLIESAFNDFESLKPVIESLIVSYGPHPITEQLKPLRRKRILYATSISFQVRGLVKGFIDGADNDIVVAKSAVNRYLNNLRLNNEEIINERIDQFLNEIDTDLAIYSAMSALGFIPYIDNLKMVHSDLKTLLVSRNASFSKREKGKTSASSKAVRNGLEVLFMRISSAMYDNKELNYNPLINELNEKLTRYKALIKARATALSAKKYASQMAKGTALAVVMPGMHVSSVNDDDFGDNQNQKRTAAPSRKNMQLSPINNEQ